MGTKEGGSRFLTFVDAILGFKHLLTDDDLDKALSMCASLKGKLKSRFLVLSDDRTPPPPPVNKNRGKRGHDDQEDDQGTKRNRVTRPPPPKSGPNPGVSGVKRIIKDSSTSAVGSFDLPGGAPRRSTPTRNAKRVPVGPATTELAMDVVSLESNSNSTSTEDWASSKSHDDTIE